MAQVAVVSPSYHVRLKESTIIEPSPRWVKATFNGETIVDSKHVLFVKEPTRKGDYYFPKRDVGTDLLIPTDKTTESSVLGTATYWHLKVGDKLSEEAALTFTPTNPEQPNLSDYITFRWNKLDRWFEENEEVFGYLRNPYHRIDIAKSTRHVEVSIGGQVIAETRRPHVLFETSGVPRYYIDPSDILPGVLEPSDTKSYCQYKGTASYWSFRSGDTFIKDVAWSYEDPIPESNKIKGLIAFYPDRVDALRVDGETQSAN